MVAGAAVPDDRAQRRDQHSPRQQELDEIPRNSDGRSRFRRAFGGHQAADPGRCQRHRGARRGVRGDGPLGPRCPHCQADPGPRGLGQGRRAATRAPRHVRLLRVDHGGLGRPGRAGDDRRPLGRGGHGPQRAAPDALCADRRRPAGHRLRGRHGRAAGGVDRLQGPPRAGPDGRGRLGRRRRHLFLQRPGHQGPDRRRARLPGAGRGLHHLRLDPGPRCPAAGPSLRARGAAPPANRGRPDHGRHGAAARADGRGRQGGDRQHGRRHAAGGHLRQRPDAQPLFPPELQPGDEPADRLPARDPRDEPEDAVLEPRQYPRPRRHPEGRHGVRHPRDHQHGLGADAEVLRPAGGDDRLHLRHRHRPGRLARRDRAGPRGSRDRGRAPARANCS